MPRRALTAFALPACLLTLVSLSACTGLDSTGESTDPRPVHSPAAALDADDRAADGPSADGGPDVVDPGWDVAAQEAEGVFLSMHEADSDLEFRAVDSAGTILWSAERPRVCSGFLVSDSEDGPVAVLMDQQSAGSDTLDTTASGFDLATGEKLWGPVEVPGPLLGSGLVFAGPPEDFIGAGGPRTALDPASGAELAVEDDDSPRVLALLDNHLVRANGEELIGEDLDGQRLWTRPAADLGLTAAEARETPWEAVGDSHALIGSGGRSRTLIDLRSGVTVAADIDSAGFDSRSRTLVTSDSKLHGFDLDGTKRWDAPLDGDAELSAVGAGFVISDAAGDDDGTQTRSADDGSLLEIEQAPETGDFGAPHHIDDSGARLVGDPASPLLIPAEDAAAKR
ncbi:hypothetical protein [Brevibacterium sp. SMBL_HHYL_HB1]|uniref:hypothetical protein n=1 Tax=Brevibacterium sp. SMBL_HHYL_HB1 TaxID=2777556 RepID=UPI001BA93BEB|nr:hypothetical protein [Brevibacterium sp. SMBL_HHYL_HB1]QUL79572.1 hypothetical protein IG171_01330 [Brevibacterium sp. SMBL_HHYL_HB1]